MDRAWLRAELAAGRSYESIAIEIGRDRSTVAYWARKHGLASVRAASCAAPSQVDREELAQLVEAGLTVREIAVRLSRSSGSVRHWLRKFDLHTRRTARLAETAAARAEGAARVEATCPRHGLTVFTRSPAGAFRCGTCRSEAVSSRRRAVKHALIEAAGGACVLCGYSRSPAALQFHHLEPIEKAFGISERGISRALETASAEAAKCVLLCATCHAEVEAGVATLPENRPPER